GILLSMAEDRAGTLWIAGQDSGLFRLRPTGKAEKIPWTGLGHEDPAETVAAHPSQGGLWLGFMKGGVSYFDGGAVRASYSAADGLGEGRVNSLQFDHKGTLWAATAGGLSRFENGRFATLTSKNGLPCEVVHWAIQDDSYSFWLYMPCGL